MPLTDKSAFLQLTVYIFLLGCIGMECFKRGKWIHSFLHFNLSSCLVVQSVPITNYWMQARSRMLTTSTQSLLYQLCHHFRLCCCLQLCLSPRVHLFHQNLHISSKGTLLQYLLPVLVVLLVYPVLLGLSKIMTEVEYNTGWEIIF